MASRELLARPASISGQTIGLLDISKARGAGGMAEGVQEALKDATLPKFRPG